MKKTLHETTDIPVSDIKGIGKVLSEKLAKLSIKKIKDLILHFPIKYEDRSKPTLIREAPQDKNVTVLCTVIDVSIKNGKQRVLNVKVQDQSSVLELVFFRFSKQLLSMFFKGQHLRIFGLVKHGSFGSQMMHPTCKPIASLDPSKALDKTHYPIYSLTNGLTNDAMIKHVSVGMAYIDRAREESLLSNSEYKFLSSLHYLHNPPCSESIEKLNSHRTDIQKEMIKDEMLAYSLSLMNMREVSDKNVAIEINVTNKLRKKWISSLPFTPTNAQLRVSKEIDGDLMKSKPMMRLVQGDVGSGKTLVAAMSALSAIEAGGQVALMAPTEILAEQLALGFKKWLSPFGVRVDWIAGKINKKEKKETLSNIKNGLVDVVIGTHALFQEDVQFSRLLLMIVDEQHKFGVDQRLLLRNKGVDGFYPHQLIMTATPIPRTLAMVSYADLDTSIIDELPPGRTPIKTVAICQDRRLDIINRIREVCKTEKRQVYWVCTLIDESKAIESEAASDVFDSLKESLPELRIGLVHGRMKSEEKQKTMAMFKNAELDLLVATTVIEVGVDVPNASLMIIENPERLGLAQLHQLRGRVGRGEIQSSCVLLYKKPLSEISSLRLSVLRESSDGFVVAQRDLEIRGPGELLGVKQKGALSMRLADISRDESFLSDMNQKAIQLISTQDKRINSSLLRWSLNEKLYGNV